MTKSDSHNSHVRTLGQETLTSCGKRPVAAAASGTVQRKKAGRAQSLHGPARPGSADRTSRIYHHLGAVVSSSAVLDDCDQPATRIKHDMTHLHPRQITISYIQSYQGQNALRKA